MTHKPSREVEETLMALSHFWYLGARIVDKEAAEPSTISGVLFSMFIKSEHPHLLPNSVKAFLDGHLDPNKLMPPELLEELRPKIRARARETRLPPDLLLAAAYGYALFKKHASNARLTADNVIREVVQQVSSEIEQELACPVGA